MWKSLENSVMEDVEEVKRTLLQVVGQVTEKVKLKKEHLKPQSFLPKSVFGRRYKFRRFGSKFPAFAKSRR